jgi:hypothetical protein
MLLRQAAGSGTALGEIEYIKEAMDKKPSADETLTRLHSLCYGKPGVKTMRKKNLRAFNGFADTTVTAAKVPRALLPWALRGSSFVHMSGHRLGLVGLWSGRSLAGIEAGGEQEGEPG